MSLNINLVAEAQVPANDPTFLQKVFGLVSRDNKKELFREAEPLILAIREEYNSISWRADRVRIQDSCSIRNVMRCRAIAMSLIEEDGKLNLGKLELGIQALEKYLYPLGPGRLYDAERQEWILSALKKLKQSPELQRLLRNVQAPHSNIIAAQHIRSTLNLSDQHNLHDSDARRAALAGWLTYLRQSVGSCFATAPTIIIHQEQSEQYFRDIADLLSIGQLKRTFGGKEYSAPLSPSWGAGDLKKTFVVGLEENDEFVELWLSPGILSALEAVEIIDSTKPLRNRIARAKKLIHSVIQKFAGAHGHLVASSEEMISYILMHHLGISEDDVKDAENRISAMAGGLMQTVQSHIPTNKNAIVKKYHQLKQRAEIGFKFIADCALLKAWEFTVASFAETKPTFTRWNLYASLGFNNTDEGGIAEIIYMISKEKFNRQTAEAQEHQDHYDRMYPIIRNLETRLGTATTEKDIQWLRSDYQSKVYEFRRIEQLRDDAHRKARWWANAGSLMLSYYDMLFPQYFQEVYDADMLDVGPGATYDDSPAGFRLIYKWGRTNTSQWTRIQSPIEFVEALANFFTITERELGNYAEFASHERELSELISEVVRRVRSREFLESAFDRMADSHGVRRIEDPLNNLDKVAKKPWVYTSGGSMDSLISCYWRRDTHLTEVQNWMESPTDLFIFILDVLKEIPSNILNGYAEDHKKSMLIHSPSHAFLLKPGTEEVKKGWESKDFTYTWIRDRYILPKDYFINQIQLNASQMEFLVELIALEIPEAYRHFFRRACSSHWGTATPKFFREELIKKIEGEEALRYRGMYIVSEDTIDGVLYNHLPLTSIEVIENKIELIVASLPGMEKIRKEDLHSLLDLMRKSMLGTQWVSSKQLIEMCCAVVLICLNDTAFHNDYYKLIVKDARHEGMALSKPVIFADSNWVRDKFSFVVNPGTSELELWRTDRLGTNGQPMSEWKQWLDGSRRDRKWGIYSRPFEYVASDAHPFNI